MVSYVTVTLEQEVQLLSWASERVRVSTPLLECSNSSSDSRRGPTQINHSFPSKPTLSQSTSPSVVCAEIRGEIHDQTKCRLTYIPPLSSPFSAPLPPLHLWSQLSSMASFYFLSVPSDSGAWFSAAVNIIVVFRPLLGALLFFSFYNLLRAIKYNEASILSIILQLHSMNIKQSPRCYIGLCHRTSEPMGGFPCRAFSIPRNGPSSSSPVCQTECMIVSQKGKSWAKQALDE